MLAAIRSEVFRLQRRRMPLVLLLLVAAVVAALYFLLWLSLEGAQEIVTSESDADELRDTLSLGEVANGGALSLVYLVGTIIAVILAASIVATEYNWGTIRMLLPRTAGRGAFLGAKVVAVLLFVAAVAVSGVIGAVVASAIITPLAGLDAGTGTGFATGIALTIGLAAFIMLPYVSLAFMMGLIARSTAAGVGLGLAVLFLEDPVISLLTGAGGTAERVTEFLLTPNVSVLLALGDSGATTTNSEVIQAFTTLTVYAMVFLAVTVWRFHRRDVVAG